MPWTSCRGRDDGALSFYESVRFSTSVVTEFVDRSSGIDADGKGLDRLDLGDYSAPALGDLDGDGMLGPCPCPDTATTLCSTGDLDIVTCEKDKTLIYLENVGTPAAPRFEEKGTVRALCMMSVSMKTMHTVPPHSEISTAARSDCVH